MIHAFQCNACRGRYLSTSRDGIPYMHVCGPLPADKKNPERERPDKRDENHAVDRDGKLIGIRSEGAGVKCLTDPKMKEPLWISMLKKDVAKREEKENA